MVALTPGRRYTSCSQPCAFAGAAPAQSSVVHTLKRCLLVRCINLARLQVREVPDADGGTLEQRGVHGVESGDGWKEVHVRLGDPAAVEEAGLAEARVELRQRRVQAGLRPAAAKSRRRGTIFSKRFCEAPAASGP